MGRLIRSLRCTVDRQYSHSGDHTLEATDRAIKVPTQTGLLMARRRPKYTVCVQDVLRKPADEYYVFVVSDADLARYGISPAAWNKILMQETVSCLQLEASVFCTLKSSCTSGHSYDSARDLSWFAGEQSVSHAT